MGGQWDKNTPKSKTSAKENAEFGYGEKKTLQKTMIQKLQDKPMETSNTQWVKLSVETEGRLGSLKAQIEGLALCGNGQTH